MGETVSNKNMKVKRFINLFVLAGVMALVATSCYKEDIQNLQKQIDALKSGEIATVEAQISAINTSITDLKTVDNTLKEYVTSLQSDSKKYAQQIGELAAADKTLEGKIADLQKYVDSGISNTRDWASATFATLDQMDSVATAVAAVVVVVKEVGAELDSVKKEVTGGYTKAIEAAASKLEASMKKWVSEQLADYYTIAQINATLDSLGKKQSDIDSSIVEKIQEQRAALDTAKSRLTSAYKAAIKVAIDSLQGRFDTKLATDLAAAKNALQSQIDSIGTEITNIKSRIASAEADITALLSRIQSIVVVPTFSDGSVAIEGGVDTIGFDIRPLNVAEAIAGAWKDSSDTGRANMVSFKIVKVATKGAAAAVVDTVFFRDGELKVGVQFSDLPDKAVVSLHLSFGKSEASSSYFPVSFVIPEGALSGVFSVSATTKVRFSKGNLRYTVATSKWDFYEHQYDYATSYESSVISLFTWGYGTWSTDPETKLYETGNTITDWGTMIDNKGTWRTLTAQEWDYLIGESAERQGKYLYSANVCDVTKCLVVFPDDYSGKTTSPFTADEWAVAEAAGAVCLPPAGFRNGTNTAKIGDEGDYKSSSKYDNGNSKSLKLYGVVEVVSMNRAYGSSVRLVTVVK